MTRVKAVFSTMMLISRLWLWLLIKMKGIDFKVLTSKNQRHKVLQLHAQINQQSLDMLKLLLPSTGDAAREAGLNVLDKMNNFLIDQGVSIKEEIQANESKAKKLLYNELKGIIVYPHPLLFPGMCKFINAVCLSLSH